MSLEKNLNLPQLLTVALEFIFSRAGPSCRFGEPAVFHGQDGQELIEIPIKAFGVRCPYHLDFNQCLVLTCPVRFIVVFNYDMPPKQSMGDLLAWGKNQALGLSEGYDALNLLVQVTPLLKDVSGKQPGPIDIQIDKKGEVIVQVREDGEWTDSGVLQAAWRVRRATQNRVSLRLPPGNRLMSLSPDAKPNLIRKVLSQSKRKM